MGHWSLNQTTLAVLTNGNVKSGLAFIRSTLYSKNYKFKTHQLLKEIKRKGDI